MRAREASACRSQAATDAITHDHPHLTPVPLDPPLPIRTVALLHREGAYRSAATRAFTDLTHDFVRTRDYAPPT
ncbi:hypothetical protein [Nonomuraea sp. WAC 01424]|uniref:hypothetical protein n=1 Tax=Nonomuraea sp. WAC 01424 TaxID=2203200 RepID=UPI001C8B5408|nr:hypothetical protein [Nonomuraea sp. WAC 01424]